MAEDPLRSGAIFKMQSRQYPGLRSPIPRALPRGSSIVSLVPVSADTFCRLKTAHPHTKADVSSPPGTDSIVDSDPATVDAPREPIASMDVRSRFRDLCSASPLPKVLVSKTSLADADASITFSTSTLFGPTNDSRSRCNSTCTGGNPMKNTVEARCTGGNAAGIVGDEASREVVQSDDVVDHDVGDTIDVVPLLQISAHVRGSARGSRRRPSQRPSLRGTTALGEALYNSLLNPTRDQKHEPPPPCLKPDRMCSKFQAKRSARRRGTIRAGPKSDDISRLGSANLKETTNPLISSQKDGCVPRSRGNEASRGGVKETRKAIVLGATVTKVQEATGAPIAADLGKITRSGRRSVPVLDWWRSQRLSHNADGEVVVTFGSCRDELLCRRNGRPSLTTDATPQEQGEGGCDQTSHGEVGLWTKTQLSRLHTAHMTTSPAAKGFWDTVASHVEGKSPRECQRKWFEHFATPKLRRNRARTKPSHFQEMGTPNAIETPTLGDGILGTPCDDVATLMHQPSVRANGDDLFQATPMRERGHVRAARNNISSGLSTPSTPAGPGALVDEAALTVDGNSRDEHDDAKQGVSRAYVQAVSKRMRKVSAPSQKGGARVGTVRQAGHQSFGVEVRKVQRASTSSRGQALKASVTSSGIVHITSIGSGDDASDIGFSDASSSDA